MRIAMLRASNLEDLLAILARVEEIVVKNQPEV